MRAVTNLSLAYSIFFLKERHSTISEDLISHANYLIGHVKENLDEFVKEKQQLERIFSSKILKALLVKFDASNESPNTR